MFIIIYIITYTGDTFIEFLRLEMLVQTLLPRVLIVLGIPVIPFFKKFLSNDIEADSVDILNDPEWVQSVKNIEGYTMSGYNGDSDDTAEPSPFVIRAPAPAFERSRRRADILKMEKMEWDVGHCVDAYKNTFIKHLSRRCTNSDPNYGTAWFHCRVRPYDTPLTGMLYMSNFFLSSYNLLLRISSSSSSSRSSQSF